MCLTFNSRTTCNLSYICRITFPADLRKMGLTTDLQRTWNGGAKVYEVIML